LITLEPVRRVQTGAASDLFFLRVEDIDIGAVVALCVEKVHRVNEPP
jgi:hypothetical protein